MGVGFPCSPVRNDIETPRQGFLFKDVIALRLNQYFDQIGQEGGFIVQEILIQICDVIYSQ